MGPAAHARFHALPEGAFTGRALGRRWRVARVPVAGGRGWKLQAWALDGPGYISANLYELAAGPRLKPCEMPAEDVLSFLMDLQPED
ncbi:hypothetical protein GZA08_00705 [Pseudoroseicyclus sp. CLL3-39]|uniref:Peptide methionine sulfoxide reductase n=1 Tax=Pseudoroseicyclus tamaricis TaxID=2705421 RepID=A0A6B2JN89_9RHOB|nr:hypothetical protein [Pseudoroseicyclus tamaricis]